MEKVITATDLKELAASLESSAECAESNSSGRGSRESEAGSIRAETLRDVAACITEFLEG